MDITSLFAFVVWTVKPEILDFGSLQVRWYGLLFALGFFLGYYIVAFVFKKEGKPESELDRLLMYMVISIVVGARLGHCLFYQPDFYLSNPLEILKIWEGGLASHGAAIGVIAGLIIYARTTPGFEFFWVIDRILLTVALGACFIRAGNLFNSEIYGVKTESSYGFVFARSAMDLLQSQNSGYVGEVDAEGTGKDTLVDGKTYAQVRFSIGLLPLAQRDGIDSLAHQMLAQTLTQYTEPRQNFYPFDYQPQLEGLTYQDGATTAHVLTWGVPRHPTQIYESFTSLVLFFILAFFWYRYQAKLPRGFNFAVFLIWIFSLRIYWETIKLNQVDFEEDMTFNMGQILSFPMVALGVAMMVYALTKGKSIAEADAKSLDKKA